MTCRVCRVPLFTEEKQRGTCLACALNGERRAQTLMYLGSLNRITHMLVEWKNKTRLMEMV